MLKRTFFELDIIFDIETVPCVETALRVYPQLRVLAGRGDKAVLDGLYQIHGATKTDPKPFVKVMLHKVVSIAGIARRHVRVSDDHPHGIDLAFFALPGTNHEMSEREILEKFLTRVGNAKPEKPRMIGFASSYFDLPCLAQRALVNRCVVPTFMNRPLKPWEGADYFSKDSDFNIDLMKVLGGGSWSPNASMKLTEIAPALGIPGKLGVDGSDVADMYLQDKLADIIAYNECDTATTYLVYLEILRMNGLVTENGYLHEKEAFRSMVATRAASGADHFAKFLAEWDALQGREEEAQIEPETDATPEPEPTAEPDVMPPTAPREISDDEVPF